MKSALKPKGKIWAEHFAHCTACQARIDVICEAGKPLLLAALQEREQGK